MVKAAGGPGVVADKSGVSVQSIHRWSAGDTHPKFADLVPMLRACGLSFDVFCDLDVADPAATREAGNLATVPLYDIAASAGAGAFVDSERIVGRFGLDARWVRAALHADPKALVLLSAAGDSMEPTIRSGDLLLVEMGAEDKIDGAIYVVELDGLLTVKRIQWLAAGAGAVIKSDNAALYEPQHLSAKKAEALRLKGRVRWVGRVL